MPTHPTWPAVWRELRERLAALPRCPQHPAYPHIRTLRQGVVNDVIEISELGILVRSHRTQREDRIEARRFELWWSHLILRGSASLRPDDLNNPHPWRSRIVGAIILTALPDRTRLVHGDTIEITRS